LPLVQSSITLAFARQHQLQLQRQRKLNLHANNSNRDDSDSNQIVSEHVAEPSSTAVPAIEDGINEVRGLVARM
jgi:hypothetical protein